MTNNWLSVYKLNVKREREKQRQNKKRLWCRGFLLRLSTYSSGKVFFPAVDGKGRVRGRRGGREAGGGSKREDQFSRVRQDQR